MAEAPGLLEGWKDVAEALPDAQQQPVLVVKVYSVALIFLAGFLYASNVWLLQRDGGRGKLSM